MTRHHRRKKQIRMHAKETGRRYLDAAKNLALVHSRPRAFATDLQSKIVAAFRAAGWPAYPAGKILTKLSTHVGPGSIFIGRDAEPRTCPDSAFAEAHPDDATEFDLRDPLVLDLGAPHVPDVVRHHDGRTGVSLDIPEDWEPARIASEVDLAIRMGRRRDIGTIPTAAICAVCGDAFRDNTLLLPTTDTVRTCACCAFDSTLVCVRPVHLGRALDRLFGNCLSEPALWRAVQVLLTCLSTDEFPEQVQRLLNSDGDRSTLSPGWRNVADSWIWLPPLDLRPETLRGLGCGASLGRITADIEHAHPHLRSELVAIVGRHEPVLRGPRGTAVRNLDATVDRLWPAVIAYTVSLHTQQAERPKHRNPWHTLESFDLREWVRELDPSLNYRVAETTLREGIPTVAAALQFPTLQSTRPLRAS